MGQLTLEEFSEEVSKRIKDYLPNDIKPEDIRIEKQNEKSVLPNIYLSEKPQSIFPLLYLDSYFTRFGCGEEIESILNDIASTVDHHRELFTDDVKPYLHRRRARSLIRGRFISTSGRETDPYFMGRPVKTYPGSDIGIVYDLCLPEDVAGEPVSIPIDFKMMSSWGYTPEMLYNIHRSNSAKCTATINSIGDFLKSFGYRADLVNTFGDLMYVVSVPSLRQGAIAVTYPGVDSKLRELLGGDYYLLPVNVHMMIAVRADLSIEGLSDIIVSVNSEIKEFYDILGYTPYRFENGHIYPVDLEQLDDIDIPDCIEEMPFE